MARGLGRRRGQIINWRQHLRFPPDVNISPEAKDLIQRFLCDVENRLGTRSVDDIQNHPFFKGVDWDNLYFQQAAYVPKVENELDTQNFEQFDEEAPMEMPRETPRGGKWKNKDLDFLGYTYKNFEVLDASANVGMPTLRKKEATKRPSLSAVFGDSMKLGDPPAKT